MTQPEPQPDPQRTTLQRLIDREYETLQRAGLSEIGSLVELIEKRRPHARWRDIALEIREATGIVLSHETLRNWFADRITIEVKVS